jgi:hypothetical protein
MGGIHSSIGISVEQLASFPLSNRQDAQSDMVISHAGNRLTERTIG